MKQAGIELACTRSFYRGVDCVPKHIKTIILVLILSLIVCATCSAKVIASKAGRFRFVTPDTWYLTSLGGGDAYTAEIVSVGFDKNTAVSVKRSKFALAFREFRNCTYTQKSEFRDNLFRSSASFAQAKGYSVKMVGTNILENSIFICYDLFKEGRKFTIIENYVVSEYYCYSLVVIGTDYTLQEAIKVADSLTVDGIPYVQWAK